MGAGDRGFDDFEKWASPANAQSRAEAYQRQRASPLFSADMASRRKLPAEEEATMACNGSSRCYGTAATGGTLTQIHSAAQCNGSSGAALLPDSGVPNGEARGHSEDRTPPGNGPPDSALCPRDPDGVASDRERHNGIERTLMAALKGFTIGAGLKGGLSLFSLLARLSKRRNGSPGVDAWSSLGEVLGEALRYGLFVGSFAGAYCCLDEGIASLWGHQRTAPWRALLAGATAGPALLLVGSSAGKTKSDTPAARAGHTSLALYVLVRAAVLAVRCGIKSPRWGWLFRPLSYEHGDVLLMCLSSSQILTAWLLEPSSLPPSYVSFLNKHGGKPVGVVQSLRELALSNGQLTGKIASQIAEAWKHAGPERTAAAAAKAAQAVAAIGRGGVAPAAAGEGVATFAEAVKEAAGPLCAAAAAAGTTGSLAGFLPGECRDGAFALASSLCLRQTPCPLLHPGETCVPHFLRFVQSAYARAIMVYIPVYVVPALVVHRATWLKKPLSILARTTMGTARSSLFLTAFCSSAWLYTCALHQLLGRCTPGTLAAGTFPTGLSVLLEKKSRRMELALYCFSRAIESFFICVHKWGWLPHLHPQWQKKIKGTAIERVLTSSNTLDVCILGCAASIIMHCYANEREVFRSKYLNVLDWVFGGPALGCPDVSTNNIPPKQQV